jgi:hypothetical protein
MTNLTKRIELLANIAIIVVALLLGGVLVKRYLLPQPNQPAAADPRIAPGTKLSVPGIEWAKSKQTVLLVLSDTCHFCTESAGFYQRLAQERAKRSDLRLVAVLPQEPAKGEAYMSKLGVTVDQLGQVPLNAVNVKGTPTVILVDNAGAVIESWVGKLPAEEEAKVISRL